MQVIKFKNISYEKAIIIYCYILTVNVLSAHQNSRLIVLTDIECEQDDTQSMIRLLLYSNQIDIKGLVATTSIWKKTNPETRSIFELIDAYKQVRANLNRNEKGFPSSKYLKSIVCAGQTEFGMSAIGDNMDTEGSNLIIKELEKNDSRPLWISVWGGVNTLGQALYTIKKTRTKSEAKRLISKLRVYTISDQDDSGVWIRNNFPNLFYIVSPTGDYGRSIWVAMNMYVKGIDNKTISNSWLLKNIQQDHGPLGALYRDVAYGMEGDTPSFLGLIPNGLNYYEHPNWGGWAGRYELYKPKYKHYKSSSQPGMPDDHETRAIWTNASDTVYMYDNQDYGRTKKLTKRFFYGDKVTIWRWRDDFQNDFAARMDWCVKSYKDANHPPIVKIKGDTSDSKDVYRVTVRSGTGLSLDAGQSFDPDGDHLSFLWLDYSEAGNLGKRLFHDAQISQRIYLLFPKVSKTCTTQIILKVIDHGKPSLTRYKRIIVTVEK